MSNESTLSTMIERGLLAWFFRVSRAPETWINQVTVSYEQLCASREWRAKHWRATRAAIEYSEETFVAKRVIAQARLRFMEHVRHQHLISRHDFGLTERLRYSGYASNIPPLTRWPEKLLLELGILSEADARTVFATPDCSG